MSPMYILFLYFGVEIRASSVILRRARAYTHNRLKWKGLLFAKSEVFIGKAENIFLAPLILNIKKNLSFC